MKWEERIFPGVLSNWRSILGFCKYALVNSFSIPQLTDFLESTIHNIVFVAVSEWMKERAEVNWKCKKEWEWNVIPNIVNTDKFNYVEKSPSYVNKLLSIRPFTTGKYANDITVECISKLIKDFSYINIEATIIGKGPQYERIVSPIKNIPNINLVNRFLDSDEIISYHKKNGLFICPTRQDAQGVSMCEAMASGLVPITLYNTAIPEFLPNDERLVCHDVNDMIQLIIRLIQNPQEFLYLSKLCRSYIDKKCGYKETVEKEIELFKRLER